MSDIKSHPLDVKQRDTIAKFLLIGIGISTSLSMDSFNFMKLSS